MCTDFMCVIQYYTQYAKLVIFYELNNIFRTFILYKI